MSRGEDVGGDDCGLRGPLGAGRGAGFDAAQSRPVGGLIAQHRHDAFVGRVPELTTFIDALNAPAWPFHLLHVHGPPGVGKTELLIEYARLCASAGVATRWLEDGTVPLDVLPRSGERLVLFVDDAATARGHHRGHLSLVDDLPASCLLVLASRRTLPLRWHADNGWRGLVRAQKLGNLSLEDARAYVRRCGLPVDRAEELFRSTHGHPLTLALCCSSVRDSSGDGSSSLSPPIIDSLLELLLDEVDTRDRRHAVDAVSVVRRMREDLLAEMLGVEQASELFRWLCGRSFVEAEARGLVLQPAVRTAVLAHLRWRNPARLDDLVARARGHCVAKMREGRGREQRAMLGDYVHLARLTGEPADATTPCEVGSFTRVTSGTQRDLVIETVAQQDGEDASRCVTAWLDREPQHFRVCRCSGGDVSVVRTVVVSEARCRHEPPMYRLAGYLAEEDALGPGEHAVLLHYWLGATKSRRATCSCLLGELLCQAFEPGGPALTFVALEPGGECEALLRAGGAQRLESADHWLGASLRQVYVCDWRRTAPEKWLELLAAGVDAVVGVVGGGCPAPTPLKHDEFIAAVRQALRDFHDAGAFSRNELLRSRLVAAAEGAGVDLATRGERLREIVLQAATSLERYPRGQKLYQALRRTYLDPAPTQECAAELLGLPLSTYRRHLRAGVEQLGEILWRRELDGGARMGTTRP